MTRTVLFSFFMVWSSLLGCEKATAPGAPIGSASTSGTVSVETSLGAFVIETDASAAPDTVANFLAYVDAGFYDGGDGLGETTFHRVIANFMVQGGGYKTNGNLKPPRDRIDHEGDNGLLNLRGTVAMARTSEPDSATCQFFVSVVDNASLDYVSEASPGYVVFGKVITGMDVVDAIAAVETDAKDAPLTPVVIQSVRRVEE